MASRNKATWLDYLTSIGDRSSLFQGVRERWLVHSALYPGSYVDLSPSVAVPSVTYVDTDRRAAAYFADEQLVRTELRQHVPPEMRTIQFIHQDYTGSLPVEPASFDVLISLYAGLVWDHCKTYLAPGGLLLANASHGDASIAALDPDLTLIATVHHRNGHYTVSTADLDTYLIPKKPATAKVALIRQQGRGIAYTRTAFAYIFQRRSACAHGSGPQPTDENSS